MSATQVKRTPKASGPQPGDVLFINPSVILMDSNVRFKLVPTRISALMEDILSDAQAGGPGVRSPIEVEPLTKEEKAANPGKEYRLQTGAYRTTSVLELNDKKKAGLSIQAIVRNVATPLDRLKRQLSENTQRQNMTYMDVAYAIDRMEKEGMTKPDIRSFFPRLGKNNKLEPASNSWINICHSFLDFTADIKTRINDGRIGFESARILRNKERDLWDTIIKQIEDDRLKVIDKESKEEAKYLSDQKKEAEAADKEANLQKALDDAKALVVESTQAVLEAQKAAVEKSDIAAAAYKHNSANMGNKNKEIKDAAKKALDTAEEGLKSATAQVKSAEDTHAKNLKALDKAQQVYNKYHEIEAETPATPPPVASPRLPQQVPAPVSPAAPIKPSEVDRAAHSQGSKDKVKPRTLKEVRDGFDSLRMLSSARQKKVKMLSELLLTFLDNQCNDAELTLACADLLGEK